MECDNIKPQTKSCVCSESKFLFILIRYCIFFTQFLLSINSMRNKKTVLSQNTFLIHLFTYANYPLKFLRFLSLNKYFFLVFHLPRSIAKIFIEALLIQQFAQKFFIFHCKTTKKTIQRN